MGKEKMEKDDTIENHKSSAPAKGSSLAHHSSDNTSSTNHTDIPLVHKFRKRKHRKRKKKPCPKVDPSSQAHETPEHLKSYPNIENIKKFNPNFYELLVSGMIKLKLKNEEATPLPEKTCFRCKVSGHLAANCPTKKAASLKLNEAKVIGSTSPSGDQESNKVNGVSHCFTCKKSGHFSNHCPQSKSQAINKVSENPIKKRKKKKKEASTLKFVSVEKKSPELTPAIAIDCEMVGVGDGGRDSNLARVSLVNQFNECLYDKYVKPIEEVTDYRTAVSGIRPEHLVNAEEFKQVQTEVAKIIDKKILVGHSLKHDLQCLFLSHPKSKIRDTAKYKPFRALFNGQTPSLKRLAEKVLGIAIQGGEHNSVEDARAAMSLYARVRKEWEYSVKFPRHEMTGHQQQKALA